MRDSLLQKIWTTHKKSE